MSRSGGERGRPRAAAPVVAAALLVAAAGAALAAAPALPGPAPLPESAAETAADPAAEAAPEGAPEDPAAAAAAAAPAGAAALSGTGYPGQAAVDLPPATIQALALVPQLWSQWLRAFYQDRPEGMEKAVSDLLVAARQLGMRRLPDLSLAAAVRAVEAAGEGEGARAQRALVAAEVLDPGRPETAFAAAEVARREGRWPASVIEVGRGYARLLAWPALRRLALYNAARFALGALLAAGVLFVALQAAAKGGALVADLVRLLETRLPRAVAYPAALVLLLWPLALPLAPLWLLVWWTVLLWGYGSPTERAVMVAVWLAAGAAPLALSELRPRLAAELSPPARAMEALAEQRLYGELLTDLAALPSLFPDSVPVRHLLADFHRRFGDWAGARELYLEVLEAEPGNVDALIGLGGYSFDQGDYAHAAIWSQRAVAADPASAAAHFMLSQALLQQYLAGAEGSVDEESKRAEARARELAPDQVSAWIAAGAGERLQLPEGGLARVPELHRRLLAVERGRGAAVRGAAEARRWAALLAAAGVALAALALHLARRPFGYAEPVPVAGRAGRWLRALVPGYGSAVEGRGLFALAALLTLAGLLLLPLGPRIGYPLPVLFAPGVAPLAAIAGVGLGLLLGLRVWGGLRGA